MRIAPTLAFICVTMVSAAQNFADKTNAIHVSTKQPMSATSLPIITWVTPRVERSNSIEETITIEATVQSAVPLTELRFEMTSGGESRTRNIPVVAGETKKIIRQSTHLLTGENIIRLVAVNEKGGQVSTTRSILVGNDAIADAVDINRKDYALIFATDNYDNWGDLINPVNDSRMIENLLKEKYGSQ